MFEHLPMTMMMTMIQQIRLRSLRCAVLNALCAWPHSIPMTTLLGKYYYFSLTDKEIEPQRQQRTCSRSYGEKVVKLGFEFRQFSAGVYPFTLLLFLFPGRGNQTDVIGNEDLHWLFLSYMSRINMPGTKILLHELFWPLGSCFSATHMHFLPEWPSISIFHNKLDALRSKMDSRWWPFQDTI